MVVAHMLSFSETCGIFLDQGSNPCPLHCKANFYLLCHWGTPYTCLKTPRWLPIAQNSCMITINTQLHHSVPCGFSTPIRLAFIPSLYSLSLTTWSFLIWNLQPVHFSSSVISSQPLSLPLLHLL